MEDDRFTIIVFSAFCLVWIIGWFLINPQENAHLYDPHGTAHESGEYDEEIRR
jgi:hypothetical protein